MEPISRSSSSSTHLSDTALLEDSEKQPGFLNNRRAKRRLPWPILIPWVLCLMLLVGMFVQTSKLVDCSQEHFAPGEWEIAKREAPLKTKLIQFTGGLRWNESMMPDRILTPGEPDYAGFPTPEIDAAWRNLTEPLDLYMTEEELQENIRNRGVFQELPAGDHLYTEPETGLYQAGPTAFHNMHCLNRLRRALYIEHYPQDVNSFLMTHLQHCLESLRQSLMCASDMTPIPEAYTNFRPRPKYAPVFQVHHTCRDYRAIQEWAKSRNVASAEWKQNARRLKPSLLEKNL